MQTAAAPPTCTADVESDCANGFGEREGEFFPDVESLCQWFLVNGKGSSSTIETYLQLVKLSRKLMLTWMQWWLLPSDKNSCCCLQLGSSKSSNSANSAPTPASKNLY